MTVWPSCCQKRAPARFMRADDSLGSRLGHSGPNWIMAGECFRITLSVVTMFEGKRIKKIEGPRRRGIQNGKSSCSASQRMAFTSPR
jgi:hypothetical protein